MSKFIDEIENLKDDLVLHRRHFHMYPEIGLDTQNTEEYIKNILLNEGYEFLESSIGLIAILKYSSSEEYIAFRADMDALPVTEENSHSFVSTFPGKMHACGHDGHSSILLETAKVLIKHRDELKYNILFIFQPAEEGPFPGGAKTMVNDLKELGLLDKIKFAFAMHLTTEYPASKFGIKVGSAMASTDEFLIKFIGKGGHSSTPQNNIDAISASSKFIELIESFMSKGIDPLIPAVFSIGKINGGSARNVVAGECTIEGTIRNQDENVRNGILIQIEKILKSLEINMGCKYELNITHGLPVLINDEGAIDIVKNAIDKYMDKSNKIIVQKPSMGAEDFSFFAEVLPVAYIWLGGGFKEKEKNFSLHNPKFDFDEDALVYGVKLFTSIAFYLSEIK